jgi:hypothetical protein
VLRHLSGVIELAAQTDETRPWRITVPTEGDSVAWEGLRAELLAAVRGRPVVGADRRYSVAEIEQYRAEGDTLGFVLHFMGRLKCETPPGRETGSSTTWVASVIRLEPGGWTLGEQDDEPAWGHLGACFTVARDTVVAARGRLSFPDSNTP